MEAKPYRSPARTVYQPLKSPSTVTAVPFGICARTSASVCGKERSAIYPFSPAASASNSLPVQLTDGDEENLKITTPLDLELAALILRRRANA